jgi:hypothetical protein
MRNHKLGYTITQPAYQISGRNGVFQERSNVIIGKTTISVAL